MTKLSSSCDGVLCREDDGQSPLPQAEETLAATHASGEAASRAEAGDYGRLESTLMAWEKKTRPS